MKKAISVIMVLVTLFTLVSCEYFYANTSTIPNETDSASSTTPTTTPTTPATSTTQSTVPNETQREPSEGLVYEKISDYLGEGYAVVGIGTCTDKDLVIPSEYMGLPVYAIGQNAFMEAAFIETVFIPDTVIEIGYLPFPFCNSLMSIEVSPTHPGFVSIDGDLYIKEGIYPNLEGKIFYQYALGKTNTAFTIPEGVSYVMPGAFASCSTLEEIIVSEDVVYIEYAAFAACTSLKKVTIPANIEYLGPALFEESINLDTIIYTGTVEQWNDIEKDASWDYGAGEFTIYCIDGEIAKDGTVTYK